MVASKETVEGIYAALQRHVPEALRDAVVADLAKVGGNRSFKETVALLIAVHGRRKEEGKQQK